MENVVEIHPRHTLSIAELIARYRLVEYTVEQGIEEMREVMGELALRDDCPLEPIA